MVNGCVNDKLLNVVPNVLQDAAVAKCRSYVCMMSTTLEI